MPSTSILRSHASSLSSVLMSRLLLNLRLFGEQQKMGGTEETLTIPSFVRPGLQSDQGEPYEDHEEDGLMPFADELEIEEVRAPYLSPICHTIHPL